MQDKQVALVTGANKGIGLQIARALASRDFAVLVGSRSLDKGVSAAAAIGPGAVPVQLDVTDAGSISAAASRITRECGRLDVLVNNAGISHAGQPGTPFDEILSSTRMSHVALEDVRAVFETNVFGVIAVTQALLPLLKAAPNARIVNVSSGAGSLARAADPNNPGREKFGTYSASKTALNAVTLAFAIELERNNIKVNAVCPGFTSTDLNSFLGTQSVEEGAEQPVSMALIAADGPSGTFTTRNGPMPW